MDENKDLNVESEIQEHGRYAVSLLPRSSRSQAYNMECMVDHTTGEFLVKSESGVVLSFDKYSRFTEHLNTFSNACKSKRIVSNIYEIETGKNFPSMIDVDTNILDSTVPFGVINTIDKIMISVDLDTIDISSIITPVVLEDEKTEIEVTLVCNTTEKTKTFTKSQLNNYVFNVKELFPSDNESSEPIACKSIKILTNEFEASKLKCLVSGILVSFI